MNNFKSYKIVYNFLQEQNLSLSSSNAFWNSDSVEPTVCDYTLAFIVTIIFS